MACVLNEIRDVDSQRVQDVVSKLPGTHGFLLGLCYDDVLFSPVCFFQHTKCPCDPRAFLLPAGLRFCSPRQTMGP